MSKVTATTLVHYQEVQEILNEYRLLHETMMRSSALYKTTYRQLSTKMSALEKKLGGTPPDILSLLFEYVGLPRTESVPAAAAAATVPSPPPPPTTTTTTTTTGDETRVVDAKKKTPKRKQSHPHKQATPVKKQKRDSKPDLKKKKKKTISKKKPTPTGKKSPEKRRMNRHAWEKLPNWLKLVWPLEEDANVPHYPLAMETDLDGTDRETDTAGTDRETDTAAPAAAPDVASIMDLPTMTPMELEGGLEKVLEAQGCCPPPVEGSSAVAPAAVEELTPQQKQELQRKPYGRHINPVIPSWLKEEEQQQEQQEDVHPVFKYPELHINPVIPSWVTEQQEQNDRTTVFPDDPFQDDNLTATQKNCKACLHNNQCRLLNITDQGNYMCHLCLRLDKVCQGECFYGLLSEDMPDFTGHLFPSECVHTLRQQETENKNC